MAKKAARKTPTNRKAPTRRTTGAKRSKTAVAVKGTLAGAAAAVARRLPGASRKPDAIALLETDHRRLETLLKQGADTTARAVKRRTELLDTITAELNVHELIEEKVLYPALKAHPEAKEIVLEGYQEHHVVDLVAVELHGMRKDDERWGAKFKVLKENIEHHIKEEEGEMFRTARAVMSRADLQKLGAEMEAMKTSASGMRLARSTPGGHRS